MEDIGTAHSVPWHNEEALKSDYFRMMQLKVRLNFKYARPASAVASQAQSSTDYSPMRQRGIPLPFRNEWVE